MCITLLSLHSVPLRQGFGGMLSAVAEAMAGYYRAAENRTRTTRPPALRTTTILQPVVRKNMDARIHVFRTTGMKAICLQPDSLMIRYRCHKNKMRRPFGAPLSLMVQSAPC
jgi:hypothetical protein